MRDKDDVTDELVRHHFEIEPNIVAIYRVIGDNEADPGEPIRLLQVNSDTLPTGELMPFLFRATADVPYQTVIAEVTPDELDALERQGLPAGWDLKRARKYERTAA
jgi:hypothetical protein